MASESDLEIVHDDGTVTDKRDGIRRPYNEHVANWMQSHQPTTGVTIGYDEYQSPPTFVGTARRRLLPATMAGVFGGLIVAIVSHIRW